MTVSLRDLNPGNPHRLHQHIIHADPGLADRIQLLAQRHHLVHLDLHRHVVVRDFLL